jgi:hypothetical protein
MCRIRCFYAGDYEDCRLLGCGAVWVYYKQTFRRNVTRVPVTRSTILSTWREATVRYCVCPLCAVDQSLNPYPTPLTTVR